jgi:hypothetical protein
MSEGKLSHVNVAELQLICAINLLFKNENEVPILVLLHGAWSISKDILKHKGIESSRNWIAQDNMREGLSEKDIWKILDSFWNFCKHADQNPEELVEFPKDYVEIALSFAIDDYSKLCKDKPIEMDVYQLWFVAKNCNLFGTLEITKGANIFFPNISELSVPNQRARGLEILQQEKNGNRPPNTYLGQQP